MRTKLIVIKSNLNLEVNRFFLPKAQLGSSLIEVLVSLVIMAIGLLGLASVEIISLKSINNSQFRSLATFYACDMAERIRSNQSGDYDGVNTTTVSVPTCSTCSVEEVVKRDTYQWGQEINQSVLSGGLPAATGTVSQESHNVFNITVVWQEQGQNSRGGTVDNANFTLSVQR